jgi:two-component system chemotaxis response regulator CheY
MSFFKLKKIRFFNRYIRYIEIMVNPSKTLKALVIDGNKTTREQTKNTLQILGIRTIDCAADGMEATVVIESSTTAYDLILAERYLDKIDGMELFKLIKGYPQTKNSCFVMLTTEADRSKVLEAIQMGVDDYLIKPLKVEELKNRLGKVVSKKLATFIEELEKFATGADIKLSRDQMRNDDRDKKILEIFISKLQEIKMSASQLNRPVIGKIASQAQDLATNSLQSKSKRMRKVLGCLWDSISMISFMFDNPESGASEEVSMLSKKIEKMNVQLTGGKVPLSDSEIESLMFEKMVNQVVSED